MTTQELFDRIQTWNTMYDQIPIPPAQSQEAETIKQQVETGGTIVKLHNALSLEVISALVGTPAEDDLRRAIDLAKTHDPDNLNEIHNLLIEVQKYMHENGLCY